MEHSNPKRSIQFNISPTDSQLSPKRINIMIVGAPVTGKTTIIEFLSYHYSTYTVMSKDHDHSLSEWLEDMDETMLRRILPTLGVKIKFLDVRHGESEENQVVLWEMGRALSFRPTRVPADYFHWMQAFIFVCRADRAPTMKVLNDWYELIKHERDNFNHATFVHMNDLIPQQHEELTWYLREELHVNLYFTSMKTREGRLNLLLGFKTILNDLLENASENP